MKKVDIMALFILFTIVGFSGVIYYSVIKASKPAPRDEVADRRLESRFNFIDDMFNKNAETTVKNFGEFDKRINQLEKDKTQLQDALDTHWKIIEGLKKEIDLQAVRLMTIDKKASAPQSITLKVAEPLPVAVSFQPMKPKMPPPPKQDPLPSETQKIPKGKK